MEDKTKADDLYDELRKTLDSSKESEEEETSVATDPNIPEGDDKPEIVKDENGELSEEEISKLHPKAQKRIKELADRVKELAEKPEIEKETPPADDKETVPQSFKNVKEFLEAVEDEPSRNLLAKFYEVIRDENKQILSPIEKANNETKFETEFSKYEKIEGLSDYKNDLKKTFLSDPNQNLKSLIGEVVTDLAVNKIKPIESKPSTPNRGKVDTANLSKDELYDMLDTLRE